MNEFLWKDTFIYIRDVQHSDAILSIIQKSEVGCKLSFDVSLTSKTPQCHITIVHISLICLDENDVKYIWLDDRIRRYIQISLVCTGLYIGVNSIVIAHLTVIGHFNKKYAIIRKCIWYALCN